MGNKKCLIKALKCCYEPPKAKEKRAFIWKIRKIQKRKPGLHLWYMLKTQYRYVSKWVWVGFALFFVLSLFAGNYLEHQSMGEVFAMIPFLVVLVISESVRSCRYGMEELELAARFSLKSIIFMRLILLGVLNVFVLFLAAIFMENADVTVIVYMLVPFLVSALGGLTIVQSHRGKEGIYMCAAFACVVAVTVGILPSAMPYLFEVEYLAVWLIVCAICTVLVGKTCYHLAQTAAMCFE